MHDFFLSTISIFNKSSSLIQCHTLFCYKWSELLICLRWVNKFCSSSFFYMWGSRFSLALSVSGQSFYDVTSQHLNCLLIAWKCLAHQIDSKDLKPEAHFFMKSCFIFLAYLNPSSVPSSLDFFKLAWESKVNYVKNSQFIIIFWPVPFFLSHLIWQQSF